MNGSHHISKHVPKQISYLILKHEKMASCFASGITVNTSFKSFMFKKMMH